MGNIEKILKTGIFYIRNYCNSNKKNIYDVNRSNCYFRNNDS